MKKYTTKELKEKWVEFVEKQDVNENSNKILSFICWIERKEEDE